VDVMVAPLENVMVPAATSSVQVPLPSKHAVTAEKLPGVCTHTSTGTALLEPGALAPEDPPTDPPDDTAMEPPDAELASRELDPAVDVLVPWLAAEDTWDVPLEPPWLERPPLDAEVLPDPAPEDAWPLALDAPPELDEADDDDALSDVVVGVHPRHAPNTAVHTRRCRW